MFESEIYFKTSRSSGSGGQNVNKVSTKVELNFDVIHSKLLTEWQRQQILAKLSNKISKSGILKITCQETPSQFENKTIALKKFKVLLTATFQRPKKRHKTKASKNSKEKRLKSKKNRGEIKKVRSKIRF